MDLTALTSASVPSFIAEFSRHAEDARTLEEAAMRLAQSLYETCAHQGQRSLVLSRLFQSFHYAHLPADIAAVARAALGQQPDDDERFLVLLGTWGDDDQWKDRRSSRGHKAIPLAPRVVASIPMLSRAVQQVGFDLGIQDRNENAAMKLAGVSGVFGVFHVEHAPGSEYIPAQDSFVAPYGVQSVIGAGAKLPDDNISLFIGFSRHSIPHESSIHFSTLLIDFHGRFFDLQEKIFAPS